jgi:hypothetical protein
MMRRYGNMFNGNRNGIGAWGNLKCKILDSTLSGSPFKVTPFWDGRLGAMGNYGLAGRRQHRLARIAYLWSRWPLKLRRDLAIILAASPPTVRRDVRDIRAKENVWEAT